jgi:hypothetical protein
LTNTLHMHTAAAMQKTLPDATAAAAAAAAAAMMVLMEQAAC